jgi:hypothetical protein
MSDETNKVKNKEELQNAYNLLEGWREQFEVTGNMVQYINANFFFDKEVAPFMHKIDALKDHLHLYLKPKWVVDGYKTMVEKDMNSISTLVKGANENLKSILYPNDHGDSGFPRFYVGHGELHNILEVLDDISSNMEMNLNFSRRAAHNETQALDGEHGNLLCSLLAQLKHLC